MIAVRVWCLVLCATILHAQPLEVREKREASGAVIFPETPVAAEQRDEPILSEAAAGTELERDERSPDDEEYEDYGDDPEGRHLHKIKRKLKRKFKPYQSLLGALGGFGGYGGHGGHGGHHQHQHQHHHHGGHGGYDCRKLHGCGGFGGGWQQPSYGGGPIATAIAGPSYGGWNPGYGGYGSRPGSNANAAAWNFGPFSFGLANAGK